MFTSDWLLSGASKGRSWPNCDDDGKLPELPLNGRLRPFGMVFV